MVIIVWALSPNQLPKLAMLRSVARALIGTSPQLLLYWRRLRTSHRWPEAQVDSVRYSTIQHNPMPGPMHRGTWRLHVRVYFVCKEKSGIPRIKTFVTPKTRFPCQEHAFESHLIIHAERYPLRMYVCEPCIGSFRHAPGTYRSICTKDYRMIFCKGW